MYAISKNILQINFKNIVYLSIVIFPLLISYSFGVIATSAFTILIIHLAIVTNSQRIKYVLFLVPVAVFLGFYLNLSSSMLVSRFFNFISGLDTSGNARTYLSFSYAIDIAQTKSIFFGTGFGQTKLIGPAFMAWTGGRLPNVAASTLSTFGILGLVLRFSLEIFLFFKTKVYTNYFRLLLFVFIFLYQFGGSYITSMAEYVIWLLAFSAIFPEFNFERYKSEKEMAVDRAVTSDKIRIMF